MKTNKYKSTMIIMLASFGSMAQSQQFTTSGIHSFVAPDGVLSVKVEAVGAGGGGGRVRGSSARESGGGGGGAYAAGIVNVISGNSYTINVGAAGVQNDNTTQHGGNSYFGSVSSSDASTTVRAEGGKTLILSDGSNGTGAQGGKAANSVGNSVKYDGGNGGNTSSNTYGGGGGGAAGSNGSGGDGGQGVAGMGTSSYGGNGGAGGVSGGNDSGSTGYNYGGGGGGARKSWSGTTVNRYGASGAIGFVSVSWSVISDFSPSVVCAGSGEVVTVTGINFTHIDSVTVNGVSVSFTPVDNTQFLLQIPAGVSSGNIIAYTENGSSVSLNALEIHDYSVSVSLQGGALIANYTGGNGASYQWKNCVTGAIINGAVDAVFTPTQNGLYSVEITENGCISASECITVSSVGIDLLSEKEFSIYPNPARQFVTVDVLNHTDGVSTITLTDTKGATMIVEPVNNHSATISLEGINSGLYFLTIRSGNRMITSKVIKE